MMPRVIVPAQSERVSDGEGLLTDLKVLGVAKRCPDHAGGINLDDRQIMSAIASDHFGLVGLLVVQRHFDLRGVADHVKIGEDVSFFVDNEARTLAFLGYRSIESRTPQFSR